MTTLNELKRIIARVTHGNDEIGPETALKDIKADSLHWVQIIVGVENAFHVELDVAELKDFTTIGDLVRHIEKSSQMTRSKKPRRG